MPPKFQQPLLPRAKPAAPRREAVALAYEHGRVAPRVVAKGRGDLAETIIARAKDAGLFVHESPELVALLMQVDLDKTIPAELYQAVAEILAFVYYLEREWRDWVVEPPRDADSAFVGFCRKWFEKRGNP